MQFVRVPDEQKAAIAKRYQELIDGGMMAKDAEKVVQSELNVGTTTIRKYRNFNILEASDSRIGQEIESFVKGTSTLYDENGKVKLRWVKTDQKFDDQKARELVAALADKLPKAKPSQPRSKTFRPDTLAVYPIGDSHTGLLSWPLETGAQYDLGIAEETLCGAVARAVDTIPACESALIINVGDYFHSDFSNNRTARSGNILDVDGRWAKVLRVGIKAMRQCIESALKKHEHVTVINSIGNHDDHSAMFLSIALANIYENEPRITINDKPTAVHFHEFGRNMIAVTHGHTIKMDKLPLVAASEQPEMWGRTKYRWGVTGHIHHDSAKEFNGMRVESFRTLAARDAWAASMGYLSGRDIKAVLLHKDFGEIERHVVSVEMLDAERQ